MKISVNIVVPVSIYLLQKCKLYNKFSAFMNYYIFFFFFFFLAELPRLCSNIFNFSC